MLIRRHRFNFYGLNNGSSTGNLPLMIGDRRRLHYAFCVVEGRFLWRIGGGLRQDMVVVSWCRFVRE